MMAIHMPAESSGNRKVLPGFITMRRLHDCGTAENSADPEGLFELRAMREFVCAEGS